MNVIINVEALQHRDYRGRGIGRYVRQLLSELSNRNSLKISGGASTELAPLSSEILDLRGTTFLYTNQLNREQFGNDNFLLSTAATAIPEGTVDEILRTLLPAAPRASILYDLIPAIYPQKYLRTPQSQLWYKLGLERLREADAILAISQSAAADFSVFFPSASHRIYNIGAGVSEVFNNFDQKQPDHCTPSSIFTQHLGLTPRSGYVMTVGGDNFTKNTDNLLAAYACLPVELRIAFPLVLVGSYSEDTVKRFQRRSDNSGLDSRSNVIFIRNINDENLASLYRHATTFVFPSKYEGFGLPAAEAIACGAFTIVSDIPSLSEIVTNPELRFDPQDVDEMSCCIRRSLTDDQFRSLKPRLVPGDAFAWSRVADKVLSAFFELKNHVSNKKKSEPNGSLNQFALVGPLPPNQSGIADYNLRLLPALAKHARIAFCATRGSAVPALHQDIKTSLTIHPAASFEKISSVSDADVYIIGNSYHHLHAALLLKKRPGIVWLHDVRLSGLMWDLARFYSVREPWSFLEKELQNHYTEVRVKTALKGKQLEDFLGCNLLCALPIIKNATGIIVHSNHAAEMLQEDLDHAKIKIPIAVVPLSIPEFEIPSVLGIPKRGNRPFIIGTVGFIGSIRMPELIFEAAAIAQKIEQIDLEVRIIGYCDPIYRKSLETIAVQLRIRVVFTNFIDSNEHYKSELAKIDLAVQLRKYSNGESSATVADCIAFSKPLITNIPSAIEFWSNFLHSIKGIPTAEQLADAIMSCRLKQFSFEGKKQFGTSVVGEKLVSSMQSLSGI